MKEKQNNRALITKWVKGPRKNKHGDLILISHLGNLDGRKPERENTPAYLNAAMRAGFHVCCEVISRHEGFMLPTAKGCVTLPYAMLSNPLVWFRAVDAETFDALCNVGAHAFAGGGADFTLTSSNFLWTLPGHPLTRRSIAAYPEIGAPDWLENSEPAGLCSNEISRYL